MVNLSKCLLKKTVFLKQDERSFNRFLSAFPVLLLSKKNIKFETFHDDNATERKERKKVMKLFQWYRLRGN